MTELNILLVDDDPIFNYIHSKFLENIGIKKIITVVNGKEALNHISACKKESLPDFIFIDIDMPIMNGFQFIVEFRNLHISNKNEIHIIILTSSSNPLDIQHAKDLCVDCLTKPISESTLNSILESITSN